MNKLLLALLALPTIALAEGYYYPVPRPYDVAGSAHFYNKADNCITIWRDVMNAPQETQVHIQKVRFNSTGAPGVAQLLYDYNKATYINEKEFYKGL